jgi:exonuclease SbcD
LVRNPRLDYVALGHIHKPQNLTNDRKATQNDLPPVVYPGSIERVDFGEVGDEKYFVIARVGRDQAEVEWRQLHGIRPFVDRSVQLESNQGITDQLRNALPAVDQIENAIVRLVVEYPREWETMIDEAALREYAAGAFEFFLVKRSYMESRVRLPEGQLAGSLTPLELLQTYWETNHLDPDEATQLMSLAAEIIHAQEI